MRTHYDNLHVNEKASPEVIRAAYKALAQKWHPDRNPDNKARATRNFQIISRAYEVLSDPAARAEYDEEIARERASSTSDRDGRNSGSQAKPEPDPQPQAKNAPEPEPEPQHHQDSNGAWGGRGQQPPKTERPADNAVVVYPWRRFWARTCDTLIFSILGGFLLIFFTLKLVNIDLTTVIADSWIGWMLVAYGSIILLEAVCLHLFRATPGKWLFNIRVSAADGTNLSIYAAIYRTVLVLAAGQFLLLPFLSAIAMLVGYYKLSKHKTTSWDMATDAVVVCTKMGPIRVVACVIAAILALAVNKVLFNAFDNKSYRSNNSTSSAGAFDPSTAVLDTGSAKPSMVLAPKPQPTPQRTVSVTAKIVSSPRFSVGQWPDTKVQVVNNGTKWGFNSGTYVVEFTNTTNLPIKQFMFQVSSKDCNLAGATWTNFYVEPFAPVQPGAMAVIRFVSTPATALPTNASCFGIGALWSGVEGPKAPPLTEQEQRYLTAVFSQHPKLKTNRLVDQIVDESNKYEVQGFERYIAIQMAVNNVAWQEGLVARGMPALSETTQRVSKPLPQGNPRPYEAPPCIYKQVMTAADRKACGLN